MYAYLAFTQLYSDQIIKFTRIERRSPTYNMIIMMTIVRFDRFKVGIFLDIYLDLVLSSFVAPMTLQLLTANRLFTAVCLCQRP